MPFFDFREKQYIEDMGIKVLFFSSAVVTFLLVGGIMYKDYEAGLDISEYLWALGIILTVETGVYFLIFRMGATLEAGDEGIRISYPPFLLKPKVFGWNDLVHWSIREVKAMKEFGGWGYKFSYKGRKTGLILGSGPGLEIKLQTGKTWVITVKNDAMLRNVLLKYAPHKEESAS